jgi:hypothetical protein
MKFFSWGTQRAHPDGRGLGSPTRGYINTAPCASGRPGSCSNSGASTPLHIVQNAASVIESVRARVGIGDGLEEVACDSRSDHPADHGHIVHTSVRHEQLAYSVASVRRARHASVGRRPADDGGQSTVGHAHTSACRVQLRACRCCPKAGGGCACT